MTPLMIDDTNKLYAKKIPLAPSYSLVSEYSKDAEHLGIKQILK